MLKNWILSVLVVLSSFYPLLSFATVEISDGSVVALYHLDSDSVDSSGTGNNGTDTSVSYVSGHLGAGAASGGSSSHITLSSLPFTGNPLTGSISFWFNTSSASRMGMFSLGESSITHDDLQVDIINGVNKVRYVFAGDTALNSGSTVNDGNWHHVVILANSGTGTMYLDGSLQSGTLCSGNCRVTNSGTCLLYTSPSPRDRTRSRMPSSA